MPEFRKWRSINKFSDAYAKAQKFGVKKFWYRGKIKLHGTNSGIHIENGEIFAQKRTDFITVYDDNCGFANFVSNLRLRDNEFANNSGLVIYGEWAGPGVQKNDAVTKICEKTFFVFSVMYLETGEVYYEPGDLEEMLHFLFEGDLKEQNIRVIPWYTETLEIDFSRQNPCQTFVDNVMKEVDEKIAVEDPYIKETFAIEGPGEGLVFYGLGGETFDCTPLPRSVLLDYMFKAKTESHSVQKEKNRNHVAPERPDGIDDFIDMFFTEARFEQMLNQIGGEATREKTGQFMKAVMSDVHKESQQEILLCDFEWKIVPKYATPRVKSWWFAKCDQL